MKVEIGTTRQFVRYDSLTSGDVFLFDGHAYMAVNEDPDTEQTRAVRLITGIVTLFPGDNMIEAVDCTLQIEKAAK